MKREIPKIPEYERSSIYPNCNALSSSQFLRYEDDPRKFYVEYVLGVRQKPSQAMHVGRVFSACYADRSMNPADYLHGKTGTKIAERMKEAISRFPVLKGGSPEFPIWAELNKWKFRATLDDFVESSFLVVENKTGMVPWTQERVNFSDQLTFQAWCHWKEYGVPPRKIILNWWNTKCKDYIDIHTFTTSRGVMNLKRFENRVVVVIKNLNAGNFTKPIY